MYRESQVALVLEKTGTIRFANFLEEKLFTWIRIWTQEAN
jgi:hypothetical protein